jgi:hypothetical protein
MGRAILSLLTLGLLVPTSAAALTVNMEWEPLQPSYNFTIECQGTYSPVGCAEWEIEVGGSRFYYHFPGPSLEPGSPENSRLARFSAPKAGEVRIPYDCNLTGSVPWTVHAKSYAGSEEVASGTAYITWIYNSCVKPYTRHLRISRKEAEGEMLHWLHDYYVSRLRCRRAGLDFTCEAIYNSSYRGCHSYYRLNKYFEHGYGGDYTYVSVGLVRRRCALF